MGIIFNRIWNMANSLTFQIKPIKELLLRYIPQGENAVNPTMEVLDPFARDSRYATKGFSNDLNPNTLADNHLEATEFLDGLVKDPKYHNYFSVVILDCAYSPRQIMECYQGIGRKVTQKDTQIATLYKECKDRMHQLLKPGGIAICFGWNSGGFGITRGYEMIEILLVPHGSMHFDTIVTVERKK